MTVVMLAIDDLKPAESNARIHGKRQVAQIGASIRRFGFNDPIAVDPDYRIIEGHGRLLAAKEMGLKEIPVIILGHLTGAEKRAYILAHNQIATRAGWDESLLALELKYLSEIEVDFDVEITGFDTVDIDRLVVDPNIQETPEDTVPEIENGQPSVGRLGDLWLLGPHRVLCGNALEAEAYRRLMDGTKAQMSITDLPYNALPRAIGGGGRVKHGPFVMASGEMSEAEFTVFLTTAFKNIAANSADGALVFSFMNWKNIGAITAAGRSAFSEFKNLVVWVKDNAGLGTFYRSQHELIWVHKVGTAPHINTFGLGETGRYRTNVWQYPGANTFRRGRLEDLACHPTVKPVSLIADAIRDCSRRKGIILDSFLGSGTTVLAAQKTGRVCYGMELDPLYVDVILRRWIAAGGEPPRLAETGQTFDEVVAERLGSTTGTPDAPAREMCHD